MDMEQTSNNMVRKNAEHADNFDGEVVALNGLTATGMVEIHDTNTCQTNSIPFLCEQELGGTSPIYWCLSDSFFRLRAVMLKHSTYFFWFCLVMTHTLHIGQSHRWFHRFLDEFPASKLGMVQWRAYVLEWIEPTKQCETYLALAMSQHFLVVWCESRHSEWYLE